MPEPRRWVPLAEVTRPHGVRGEVRVRLFNDDSDLLFRASVVRAVLGDGTEREVRLAASRPVDKGVLVRFDGVDDRDQAAELRGARLCVARDAFPELGEGEFYACDVEGAIAELVGGETVGRVVALRSYPTCEVLAVELAEGGEIVEVPLTEAYVASIDGPGQRVRFVTLEGLR